jgi:hypothetical protein
MLRRVLFVFLLMALVAACGGGAGSESPEEGSADTGTSEPEATSDDGETLADFFGYGNDDPAAAQAEYEDEEARRQELIRTCMAKEGFDYIPAMPPEGSFQVMGPENEEERVRTQGFGITTWYGNEDQFDPGIEWEDPNQATIEAMSDSEREAYYAALYGTEEEQMEGATTETDPETGEEYTVVEGFGAGCEGEASEEIYGDQAATQDLWEQLQPDMETMYERVQADPRIVEANQEWSGCMAEAGFDYENRDTMFQTIFEDFQQRLDEIIGPQGGYADPFEGWSEEDIQAFFEEKTEDEIDAFFQQAQEEAQANIDQDALAALQQEEIDLAVADFECGKGYNELYQEVAADYEADFIAQNRDILEQIRDAQGG